MAYTEQGTPALVAKMNAIKTWMTQSASLKAVRAGGRVIAAAMVEAAPVQEDRSLGSDSLEEGELKANLKVRAKLKDGEAVALIGPAGKEGRIARAAYLVEYGHRMVVGGSSALQVDGSFKGAGKVQERDVPAYPFLRPAWEASRAAAIESMNATLAAELKEVAR